MKLVDIHRHEHCNHYACEEFPFYTQELQRDEQLNLDSGDYFMFIFVEGKSVSYTLGDDGETHRKGEPFFLFLNVHKQIHLYAGQKAQISTFSFAKPIQLCDSYSISNLKAHAPVEMTFITLDIKEPLQMCLDSVKYLAADKLRCKDILAMKLKEIFFLISAYYEPDDIGRLLAPLLQREVDFKEFVIHNFLRVSTVQELADLRGQSLRQFKKDFQEAFNTPPYTWMLQEKAKFIDERLSDPTVQFSEIIEDFGFSSPSHFTVFCRRQFNMTPTQRRKMLIKDEAERRAAERRANSPILKNARRR